MKTFTCECGVRLHFENSLCVTCKRQLGFLPDARVISALQPAAGERWLAKVNGRHYRKCSNYQQHNICNWMVPEQDEHALCFSCRLSEIIPDLSNPTNFGLWRRIERAKRRLLYSLIWLELPIISRSEDAQRGLAFHLMEDQGYSEFALDEPMREIMTGHRSGIITLNIAEADPVARELTRTSLHERYRTQLGHFRHESGHYYWDQLVKDSPRIEEFRGLFGDERGEYGQVMQNYYANGPADNWQASWISAYASSHPWEDWAETWAHYLHMIDTLETASDYGFDVAGVGVRSAVPVQFSATHLATVSILELVGEWSNLTVALNDMNRSMGLGDAYPFILSGMITRKLEFVHSIITGRR